MLNDFKKASDDQVARLGGAQEQTDQQIVQKLDDMSQMQELIKDFNLFESLYRTQQDLAQQTQAYNRPGQLGREDQLALKDLAGTEKQVADALDQLQKKLREDAKTAEKLFPKAAQSGRDLAGQIGEHRLEPLAESGHRPDARGRRRPVLPTGRPFARRDGEIVLRNARAAIAPPATNWTLICNCSA